MCCTIFLLLCASTALVEKHSAIPYREDSRRSDRDWPGSILERSERSSSREPEQSIALRARGTHYPSPEQQSCSTSVKCVPRKSRCPANRSSRSERHAGVTRYALRVTAAGRFTREREVKVILGTCGAHEVTKSRGGLGAGMVTRHDHSVTRRYPPPPAPLTSRRSYLVFPNLTTNSPPHVYTPCTKVHTDETRTMIYSCPSLSFPAVLQRLRRLSPPKVLPCNSSPHPTVSSTAHKSCPTLKFNFRTTNQQLLPDSAGTIPYPHTPTYPCRPQYP